MTVGGGREEGVKKEIEGMVGEAEGGGGMEDGRGGMKRAVEKGRG